MANFEEQAAELHGYIDTLMYRYLFILHAASEETADLSKQQLKVIQVLGRSGTSIMREVAERLLLSASTMTGIVDKLAERKLVTRELSAEDRRIVRVSLTAKGQRVYKQELVKQIELSRSILEPLTEAERKTLLALFSKVTAGNQAEE